VIFLDTNIILYAISGASAEQEKRMTALKIIETQDVAVSAQVPGEFYVNATKRTKANLSYDDAMLWVDELLRLPCCDIDEKSVTRAIETSRRYRTSNWDGAILATAERMGCETVYSEDLNPGQEYGSVTVIDPFAEAA